MKLGKKIVQCQACRDCGQTYRKSTGEIDRTLPSFPMFFVDTVEYLRDVATVRRPDGVRERGKHRGKPRFKRITVCLSCVKPEDEVVRRIINGKEEKV